MRDLNQGSQMGSGYAEKPTKNQNNPQVRNMQEKYFLSSDYFYVKFLLFMFVCMACGISVP